MEFKDELQAREYLQSTDWYFVRQLDTNEAVPVEIVTNRTNARQFIREII
jgi:hypothetical protein